MTIDAQQDSRVLAEIRGAIEAAENAGDAGYIASLFAEDAVVMVPDFPVQEGKAAGAAFIHGLLPGLLAAFDRRITYTSAEVRVLGELALDRGTFAFTVRPRGGGDTERVTGKYLWLYQRTPAGGWTLGRMIVSRDEAEPAAQADRGPAPLRLSATLALLFGVFLAVAEVVYNWGNWSFWPFWVVDYIAVGLLLTAWRASRRGRAGAAARLAGAWGFTCAMFYMSFFLHVAGVGASEDGLIPQRALTAIIGALFATTAIGFVSSLMDRRRAGPGD